MSKGSCLLHAISGARADALGEPDLELVTMDGLQAHCSFVDEERAADVDPEWLAAAAQRHHRIVQALFESGAVLPVRFGTLMDRGAIAMLLTRHRLSFETELGRLNGRSEWGVKLMIDPAALGAAAERTSDAVRALDCELAESAPGRAFLLRRKREAAVADAVENHVGTVVDQVRSALGEAAVESAELPLPAAWPSGVEMLANLAFLVRDSEADGFAGVADRVAQEAGIELELSGPWPPYSFVRLDLSEPDE